MALNDSLQAIASRLIREKICAVPLSESDLRTVEKYMNYYATAGDLCRRLSDIELNYVQISSEAEAASSEVCAVKSATADALRRLTNSWITEGNLRGLTFSVNAEEANEIRGSFFSVIEFIREQLKSLSNSLLILSETAAQVRACSASFNEVYKEARLAIYAFSLNRDVDDILDTRATLLQAHASTRECERSSTLIMGNARRCTAIISCINNTLIEVTSILHADGIEQYDGAISPIKALNAISTAISTLESFKIENIS